MTDIDLDVIQARADAASDGPWVRVENIHCESWVAVEGREETRPITLDKHKDGWQPHFCTGPADYGRGNAEFVAHARTDVPALIAAVRERDATIARVRDRIDSVMASDDLDPDGYQVAGLISSVLQAEEGQ